jgi:hypothetical protein
LTQQIDLKAIIKGANPGIARLVPDFLIRLLNRITHLREVNHILSLHGKKRGLEFIQAVLEYFQISTNFRGEKQLVGLSRPVIASNHPLGGMDGMILIGAVGTLVPRCESSGQRPFAQSRESEGNLHSCEQAWFQ